MFHGKADQMAYIVRNDDQELAVKRLFGLEEADWIEDHVLAHGRVRGQSAENQAKLLFNYDLGIELEILRYTAGANYAEGIPSGKLCHLGFHAIAGFEVPTFDAPVIQQVETVSHTNEFLRANGRHYRYTIYDTYKEHGAYMKVIERIEAEG